MKERQFLEEDFKKLGDLGEKGDEVIKDYLNLESFRFDEIKIRESVDCLEKILEKVTKDLNYRHSYEKISEWLLPEQISLSKISKNSKLVFLETKVDGRWNFGVRRFF